jgi:uncharacterized protein with HEPN domain
VLEWTEGVSLAADEHDDMLRSAVERRFEIIGEAGRRLTRDDPATAAALQQAELFSRNWAA